MSISEVTPVSVLVPFAASVGSSSASKHLQSVSLSVPKYYDLMMLSTPLLEPATPTLTPAPQPPYTVLSH